MVKKLIIIRKKENAEHVPEMSNDAAIWAPGCGCANTVNFPQLLRHREVFLCAKPKWWWRGTQA